MCEIWKSLPRSYFIFFIIISFYSNTFIGFSKYKRKIKLIKSNVIFDEISIVNGYTHIKSNSVSRENKCGKSGCVNNSNKFDKK